MAPFFVRPSERRHRRSRLIVTLLVLVMTVTSPFALNNDASAATLYPDDPNLAPGLAGVAVDSSGYRGAMVEYVAAERRLTDAERRFTENQAQIADLVLARSRLTEEHNEAIRRRDKAAGRLALIRAGLSEVAVTNYVRGGMGTTSASAVDLDLMTEMRRDRVLLGVVNTNHTHEARTTAEFVQKAEAAVASVSADLEDVRTRFTNTTAARDQALSDGIAARDDVARLADEFSKARLEAQVIGLGTGDGAEWGIGFQLVALDAYVKAAAKLAEERPACNLRWQILAGFARVESAHGTYLGRHVGADGQVSEDVIGIALDGNNNTAVIRDTDGGAIDGDSVYDRAVGPLAFIPAAWRQFGRDGNGDGAADPQNIYDGALATANLVCSHGFGLDTDEGLRRAAFSYNRSTVYVDMVVGFVKRYDGFTIPS